MLAHIEARIAAVATAASAAHRRSFTAAASLLLMAALCGCQQTARSAGPDPADPGARVAATGYRSTTAPYRSMRPSEPAAWSKRDRNAAPPAAARPQP